MKTRGLTPAELIAAIAVTPRRGVTDAGVLEASDGPGERVWFGDDRAASEREERWMERDGRWVA